MVKSFLGLLQNLEIIIAGSPAAAGPSGAGLNDEAICAPASGERSMFSRSGSQRIAEPDICPHHYTAPSGALPDGM
ncbi:MAG: hypothetical protein NT028_03070 [candidate division Zixibacteria bacterium]|nr:hypothetical protein [candidate division Zixibacteria bacterium]